MFKTTGRMPKQLQQAPECPAELMYLIEWYNEASDGEGLTYQKLHYWQLTMKRELAGWEAKVLMSIDRLYWFVQSGGKKK